MHENGMDSLSPNQIRILNFTKKYIDTNKISPTVRDICAGTGLRSTSTIHSNLRILADKGFLSYTPGARRAILLKDTNEADTSDNTVKVPLMGNVAAGMPILAVSNIQEYYTLPKDLVKGTSTDEVFMLRIKGDSMIEAGILENDYIIVNAAESISNGDIAVARIDDRVRLQPENSTMQPIYAEPENVELVGKVVGLIRTF